MNQFETRFIDLSENDKKEKVMTIALVSTIVDGFETVINPRGCLSPVESVPVDFKHNRISTECRMVNPRIQEIEMMLAGGVQKVEALVVDVIVPAHAKMWTKENKDKRANEVPSLYDAVAEGRVRWGSVDFAPVESEIEYVNDANNNLKRIVYNKWRLNFYSLLDTKPGQDTSYILHIRKTRMTIYKDKYITKDGAVFLTIEVSEDGSMGKIQNVATQEILEVTTDEYETYSVITDEEAKELLDSAKPEAEETEEKEAVETTEVDYQAQIDELKAIVVELTDKVMALEAETREVEVMKTEETQTQPETSPEVVNPSEEAVVVVAPAQDEIVASEVITESQEILGVVENNENELAKVLENSPEVETRSVVISQGNEHVQKQDPDVLKRQLASEIYI